MFHPLAEDYTKLKESEIEERLQDLSRKYFQAQNSSVKQQIAIFIDIYKSELQSRRLRTFETQQKNNKDLDKLIKVN